MLKQAVPDSSSQEPSEYLGSPIRAASLRGFARFVRDLGGDPDEIAELVGVDLESLDQPNAYIPYIRSVRLLEQASWILQRPDFGIVFGIYQIDHEFSDATLMMRKAASVGAALEGVGAFVSLMVPTLKYQLVISDGFADINLLQVPAEIDRFSRAQSADRGITQLHYLMRLMNEIAYTPECVDLVHPPLADRGTYTTHFGTRINFNCLHGRIRVRQSLLDQPVFTQAFALEKLAEKRRRQRPGGWGRRLSDEVEVLVAGRLDGSGCTLESIAAILAMGPRSLQRDLLRRGESFEQLRDRVRKDYTLLYLANSDLSLDHISAVLGYSSQSTLTRSCKRWFDKTPSQIRKYAKSPAGADNPMRRF